MKRGYAMSSEASAAASEGRGKRPLILIGAVVVVLAAAATLWFSGVLPHIVGHGHPEAMAAAAEQPVLVDLPDIVSNLDTGTHRASFIKLHAKLKVMHAGEAAILQSNLPQILDIFQTYLRSTRPDELRGGEGTYRLREALMSRIDVEIPPVQVSDLFFTQILVQ